MTIYLKYKILFLSLILTGLFSLTSVAQRYKASLFGIKDDGITLNTTSIQRAVDFIHEKGGGVLEFYVGRYLTGTIILKSNVTVHLHEGAVLVGSTNVYDYNIDNRYLYTSLLYAVGAENIGVTGKGVIDGQGDQLTYNLIDQIHKGLLKEDFKYDRPGIRRTNNVYFRECKNVTMKGITSKNAAAWVMVYDQCDGLVIDSTIIDSDIFWNNDGMDIVDCKNVTITDNYVNASDDAICFKSHDYNQISENVVVRNNVVRSSASGIKFGTMLKGRFRNIKIVNNTVYNTYRSAIVLTAPDGGVIEDIWIDSLQAYNTGNVIYLRNGNRYGGEKGPGTIRNIAIQNVYAEVSDTRPDTAYRYQGPIEDLPRNISPSSIVGIPGRPITGVTLKNIKIVYPGGANPHYAYRGTSPAELDSIPVMLTAYPEFSQFKELPAWAFYIRYANDVKLENVQFVARNRDYRPAMVIQESGDIRTKQVRFIAPRKKMKRVVVYKSSGVKSILP